MALGKIEQSKKYSINILKNIQKELSVKINNENICIVTTGSYARGEASKESDMDYFGDLIAECNSILREKSDEKESGEFKASVYQIATTVASASGDGFFGGGKKINEKEANFLHFLKSNLLEG